VVVDPALLVHLFVAVVCAGAALSLPGPVALPGSALAAIAVAYAAAQFVLHRRPRAGEPTDAEPDREHPDEDRLTGLLNRRAFERTARYVLQLARRTDMPLVVVCVRIGGLEQVDGALGYRAGDRALRTLAEIVRHRLRATDVAARFDGDEVLLVLTDTTAAGAELVTERLSAQFDEFAHKQALPARLQFQMLSPGRDAGLDEVLGGLLGSARAAASPPAA
jgi:diguanylate cyclase (GGDEF)-like protein